MDLKEFLKSQSALCEYNPEQHQEQLLKILSSRPMNLSGIDLVYERTPDFAKLLDWQAPLHTTVLGLSDKHIFGLFSVSISEKYIQGEKAPAAYIGDFRTDGSPRAARAWRRTYADLIRSLSESASFKNPRFFLTAILETNKLAIRNIAQPKKNFGFQYHLLKQVPMVNIYGRWPFTGPRGNFNIRFAKAAEEEKVRTFIDTQEKRKAFGAIFDLSENSDWNYRKKTWPGFSIENFVLVEDHQGKILAVTLPWSPHAAKRLFVRSAPQGIDWSFSMLKKLGYNMPQVGESISTLYLTHLNFSPEAPAQKIIPDILHFLIEKKYKKRYHIISFADWWNVPVRSFLAQKIPVNLYAVSVDPTFDPRFLKTAEIGFEMGLV